LDDRLSIDTPENILLDADIAGFGTRCIAAILDYLLLLAAMIIIGLLYLQSVPLRDRGETEIIAILVLIQFILIAFYHLFFEFIWNGQTPGKRWVGIRVVQANGLPATVSGILIRNLVRLFDFLPFFYTVGLLSMFATRNTQRFGDLAAKTLVIREQRQVKLKNIREDYTVTYQYIRRTEPIPYYIHIDMLDDQDHRLVIDYLQRRPQLRNNDSLSRLLARQLARKMELTSQDVGSTRPEAFLEHIAYAYEIEQKYPRDQAQDSTPTYEF